MKYTFIDNTLLSRLGSLPIESRKPMLGNVAGKHRSPHRGSSVEFAEYRKYVPGDDTRRDAQTREAARRLYSALDRLDPKQRIAFALATIDGMSMAEVAAVTESSVVAVKTRVWRARKDLMKRAAKDEVLRTYITALEGGRS